jgi:predicted amidohydrolase
MTSLKIAGVQMDVRIGDISGNLSRIESFLRDAASKNAQLSVFPECALCGYCFDSLEEARPFGEPIPGPSTERLARLCKSLNHHCVVGMLEADGPRLFNACALIGPGGAVGVYRKVHLPFLGIDRFTTPGDRPFAVYDVGFLRIGMNICYDGSFPEPSRAMTLDGADLIVLPTNWPPPAKTFAEHAINTRALENNVYYMSVDRVGSERGIEFIGMSRVCHPSGDTMVGADHAQETIIFAEIDPEVARKKHLVRIPGIHEIDRIRDRRPEFYGRLVAPKDTAAAPR